MLDCSYHIRGVANKHRVIWSAQAKEITDFSTKSSIECVI